MTIPLELAARIERLYTVEHWRVGTIARQLNVHRDTVRRVLRDHGAAPPGVALRRSLLDPYRVFIGETLEKYPTLAARRLYDMVCERGYAGQASHFRHLVSTMRARPPAEAYLRLRTLPGEQMQIDWAHFGHLAVGQARRPLMGFVAVLSYSRRVFLRFSLNAQMDSFLRGHVQAFCAFGALGRVLLYDNLKSVVLERVGDTIRFNPEFLANAQALPLRAAPGRHRPRQREGFVLILHLLPHVTPKLSEGPGTHACARTSQAFPPPGSRRGSRPCRSRDGPAAVLDGATDGR